MAAARGRLVHLAAAQPQAPVARCPSVRDWRGACGLARCLNPRACLSGS
jgi:hypothetical protein